MRRGDVHAVDFGEPRGSEAAFRRPAVIVSNDAANAAAERLERGTVTVVPITSNVQTVLPFHVLLDAGSAGLPRDSKAQAEQVRAVSWERIGELLGSLPPPLASALDDALRLHLRL